MAIPVIRDSADDTKFTLTPAVAAYLDRVIADQLASDVAEAVRRRALRELRSNPQVKKVIAKAAERKLMQMLSVSAAEAAEETPASHEAQKATA